MRTEICLSFQTRVSTLPFLSNFMNTRSAPQNQRTLNALMKLTHTTKVVYCLDVNNNCGKYSTWRIDANEGVFRYHFIKISVFNESTSIWKLRTNRVCFFFSLMISLFHEDYAVLFVVCVFFYGRSVYFLIHDTSSKIQSLVVVSSISSWMSQTIDIPQLINILWAW